MTRQSLEAIERLGPRAAWTGPVARGDFATVERHVAALADFPGEFLEAYASGSRLAAALLSEDPQAALRRLDEVLSRRASPLRGLASNSGRAKLASKGTS